MRASLKLTILAPVIALGCSNIHSFTPASSSKFEPTTTEIAILDSKPSREYTVLGYAECKAAKLEDAIPYLKKLAQANGGQALMEIQATGIGYGASNYRATVIRYAEASP